MGEQPNPWDLLQPQDATSRHRGAKPFRRCELLGRISLLSPEYLLSVERRQFLLTAGSLRPTFVPARLVSLAVKLPYAFAARTISNRAEEPCAPPLRLGGDRPSQTAHSRCSRPGSRHRVRSPEFEGWYPEGWLHEADAPASQPPPILDNQSQTPTQSCSKGSRGLSVQPRVLGIFTETTISPDPSLRQRPSRYAIRAGRNLPGKEFRYLRTVIVTAAVYWGLDSKLRPS